MDRTAVKSAFALLSAKVTKPCTVSDADYCPKRERGELLKRTISFMTGKGSINHNSRKLHAKNTDSERSYLNVKYCNENIKDVAEKQQLAAIMLEHGIEWEQKGTHEKHLSLLDFEK